MPSSDGAKYSSALPVSCTCNTSNETEEFFGWGVERGENAVLIAFILPLLLLLLLLLLIILLLLLLPELKMVLLEYSTAP
mmetsp:Transcript_2375/g.3716  ORF Transcript_2375/g.3716 Transcript_2375/m.3716 type:complete len:80 (-) Transcript_2375:51-290(-)